MLPNTLSQIKSSLIHKKRLNEYQLEKLLPLLKLYEINQLIYAGVLIRQLNITMHEAYIILEDIKEMGIIELNYEMYCHVCSKFTGQIYETLSQIPNESYCDECGSELKPLDNSIAVYRVVTNGQ